jgi:hypothetical protein
MAEKKIIRVTRSNCFSSILKKADTRKSGKITLLSKVKTYEKQNEKNTKDRKKYKDRKLFCAQAQGVQTERIETDMTFHAERSSKRKSRHSKLSVKNKRVRSSPAATTPPADMRDSINSAQAE